MNDIERDLRRRLKKSIRKRTELNNRALEYQKEKQGLIEDIKNLINIINNNCLELDTTEEEFESLRKWNK